MAEDQTDNNCLAEGVDGNELEEGGGLRRTDYPEQSNATRVKNDPPNWIDDIVEAEEYTNATYLEQVGEGYPEEQQYLSPQNGLCEDRVSCFVDPCNTT